MLLRKENGQYIVALDIVDGELHPGVSNAYTRAQWENVLEHKRGRLMWVELGHPITGNGVIWPEQFEHYMGTNPEKTCAMLDQLTISEELIRGKMETVVTGRLIPAGCFKNVMSNILDNADPDTVQFDIRAVVGPSSFIAITWDLMNYGEWIQPLVPKKDLSFELKPHQFPVLNFIKNGFKRISHSL